MKWLCSEADTLLAFGAGLVLALSFPRPDIASLAWVSLIPLFLVMERRPFRSGFAAGLGFFGLVLYWLNIVMTTYGGLAPFFSMVAYLLLAAYLALFFGAATWAACRIREISGQSPVLTLPPIWIALEFIRSFLFSGFPWATLGYSQQSHLELIQSLDLFGVYGVSFLLVFSNAVLAALWGWVRSRGRLPLPWRSLVVLVVLFCANLLYGYRRLGQGLDERSLVLNTVLAQGNIDQAIKWNPAHQAKTVEIYDRLSRDGSKPAGADLIVWPESATPFYFQDVGPLSQRVSQLPRDTGAFLLFGSPAYEGRNQRYHYLNSAFLLDKEGRVLGRSDKVHLVPFGEYVPLGRYLPFIEKLVAGVGDFSPGTVSPLPMNGQRIGVLVCFEGIFPELARDFVRKGSDVLINVTNDAWFGRSSAPYQHLAMTRYRAIENRIWVARAANTGVSAFISPSGNITQSTGIFEETFLRGRLGVGSGYSWYTRTGDVLPTVSLALSLFWLYGTRRRRA